MSWSNWEGLGQYEKFICQQIKPIVASFVGQSFEDKIQFGKDSWATMRINEQPYTENIDKVCCGSRLQNAEHWSRLSA